MLPVRATRSVSQVPTLCYRQLIRRCAPARPARPNRRHAGYQSCTASFGSVVDSVVTGAVLYTSVAAVVYSAVTAFRASPSSSAALERSRPVDDDEGLQWGLASALTFLPLFSWMSWILLALQTPDRSSLYYTFAALYITPLLRSGFDLDGFTFGMLALGIVHTQVERIARTEPEVIRELQPLRIVAQAVGLIGSGASTYVGSLAKTVKGDAERLELELPQPVARDEAAGLRLELRDPRARTGLGADGLPLPDASQLALELFDKQLAERERQRLTAQQQQQQK